MKKLIWSFLRNVFYIITLHNFRKMDSLSLYHDMKLLNNITDPVIAGLYATFHPLRKAFHEAYTAYKTALANAREANQIHTNMFTELSSKKLDKWDAAIRNVYDKDTTKYKGFFPDGHKPFHNGRYEERITFVESLFEKIGTDASLSAVKTDIELFLTNYSTALANRLGRQDDVTTSLDKLRAIRTECAVAMYANLGALMTKNAATPEITGNFFDLEQIRRSTPKSEGGTSSELTITIPKGGAKEGGFVFTADTVFLLYDSGQTQLAVNTAATSTQTEVPDYAALLEPEDELEKAARDMGMPGDRFLIITNLDPDNDGEITIDIID